MKNLILIAILGLVFSCGGEDKSSTNTNTPSAKTINNIAEEKPTAVSTSNDTKEEIAETTPESVEETKVEKPLSEVKTVKEKTAAVVQNPTNEKKVEAPVVEKEKPKKDLAAARAKEKFEAEKKLMEERKMKEAETRRKAELAAIEAEKKAAKEKATAKPQFNHNTFNVLLQKHVSATGKVNYKNFKKDETALDEYLAKLESQKMDKSWGRNKKMAFWINAYNAYTIKLILKNFPVKKITDLHGGKPWDVKWIKLDGRTLSLNNIENDILRPQYKDARIHFAVNCAAKSCPPILNRAWTAATLEKYFERQAKAFINNSSFNSISKNSVEVSKIFDWYGEDFGNLIDYLNKYSNTKIAAGTKINFKEYNWNLND